MLLPSLGSGHLLLILKNTCESELEAGGVTVVRCQQIYTVLLFPLLVRQLILGVDSPNCGEVCHHAEPSRELV